MRVRNLVRASFVVSAAALLAAPFALQTGYTDGPCPTGTHPVVNTGECASGPGGNIVVNKVGKLMDIGKCATYKGREYDEMAFHHQTSPASTAQASFVTSSDFDWTDPNNPAKGAVISVIVDDGSIVFTDAAGTRIDTVDTVKKFMATHGDVYDYVAIFPNFNHAEGSFHNHIKNDVTGINIPVQNLSASYGTSYLRSLTLYRPFTTFPTDPYARIAGNNDSTMSLMGQETGHRWAAWVRRDKDPGARIRASADLLGRNEAHWCFYTNTTSTGIPAGGSQPVDGFSSMEGNNWQDNGNGTFTTTKRSDGYSKLDQYLMGFRSVDDVDPFFRLNTGSGKVTPDCGTRPFTPGLDSPYTVSYPKINVTIQNITDVEGMRNPSSNSSQKNYRMAFICLARQGSTCTTAQLGQLNRYRDTWEPYFQDATLQGKMYTQLGAVDMDGDGVTSATDCDEEDPSIYPGAAEVCNNWDDDCDGFVDEDFDIDQDLYTSCNGDCDDNNGFKFPGNPEVVDGLDNNCDGVIDNTSQVDTDGDGFFTNATNPALADCVDSDANVYPGAAEYVNGYDDNCNAVVDCNEPIPPRVFQTDSGPRGNDGFDNDCNGIIDG